MSGAPTSAPDSFPGDEPADALWEQAMTAAAEAAAAGDDATAARRWAEAFDLADPADSGLAEDDPRRAASRAGLGMARLLQGEAAEAEALLARALAAWDASEGWIARMDPGLRPRSSAQHYRVERRFGAQHAAQALEERRRLLDVGRSAILAALASLRQGQGDVTTARELCEQALLLRERAISRRASGVMTLLEILARLHEQRGDASAAAAFRRRRSEAAADPVADGLERFQRDRTSAFSDSRALLAAALLLPILQRESE